MRFIAYCLIFNGFLFAGRALQQSKCGESERESCLSTKKREFFVHLIEGRQIKFLYINAQPDGISKGYRAGLFFEQSSHTISAIMPQKYSYNNNLPDYTIPVGAQIEFFDNGKIDRRYYSNRDTMTGNNLSCGWEYRYETTGQLIEKKNHARKCEYGTGLVRFFLPPGTYYVTEPPLRMRESPSLKSKTVATLEKDEKVEVLDYTTERLEIKGSYAPWAKVKTAKGEGWVYGAYIEPVNYGETYKKFFQIVNWERFAEKMGLE